MKKSIAFLITALFISSFDQVCFLLPTALAFDPEYTLFEPPMIYSVYEEDFSLPEALPSAEIVFGKLPPLVQQNTLDQDVIRSEHAIQSSDNTPVILNSFQDLGGSQKQSLFNTISLNKYIDLVGLTPYAEKAKESVNVYLSEINKPPQPVPPLNWVYYFEKIQAYAEDYINNYIDDIIEIASWEPPEDPSVITLEYWNDLTESQRLILHYKRNRYQGELPLKLKDVDSDEWECKNNAVAHNLAGVSGNIDCRGLNKRAGQQAIYDKNGDLVTKPENMGTFDFIPPYPINQANDHARIDVALWILYGNSPNDTTTKDERIAALMDTTEGRLCLWELDYISFYEVVTNYNN